LGYQKTFETSTKYSDAQQRIITYYTTLGYEQVYNAESLLQFKRGSHKCSFLSSNPLKWYSFVKIDIIPDSSILQVTVSYESEVDLKNFIDIYMIEEIRNLEIAVSTNQFLPVNTRNMTKKRAAQYIKYFCTDYIRNFITDLAKGIAFVIVFFIILFIVVFIVTDFINNLLIGLLIGIAITVILFNFFSKLWNKWRKGKSNNTSSQQY
jgi:uncharacterized membrane protein